MDTTTGLVDVRFQRAIASNNLIFVVGTGYTAATSNGATTAGWRGLIKSGVARAVVLGSSEEWARLVLQTLNYGFDNANLSMVLSAASNLSSELKKVDEYAFAKWLQEDIGGLKSTNSELGDALRSLPFPILTTNYDTLLEDSTRATVDWTEQRKLQEVIAGSSKAIGHIHGAWNNPESVILTLEDYQKLLKSDAAQQLQRAASTIKSIVYVGFGSGLDDPNFAQLIDWHRKTFVPSGVDHFRLCLDSELQDLRGLHGADHIHPVSYGTKHTDLPAFIKALVPDGDSVSLSTAGIVRDVMGEHQLLFEEELKKDAIIADSIDDLGARPLSEVVLPPVLLPVPQADYIRARASKDPAARIKRLNAIEEVTHSDVIVLAAEENSGLTTAVKWMALEAAKYLGGAAPIYVPFQRCKRVHRPLEEQIRLEMHSKSLIESRKSSLPPYVLALDDFTPYVDRISDRVLSELGESEPIFTVIGCALGSEEEVVARLKNVGVSATVRYVGKLSSSDVHQYARIASPTNFEALAKQVLEVLHSENLPRTPFTVGLLISVLIRGGVLSKNSSQTTILDDYVGLMLGRGDPHDDARFGLDQNAREAILGWIAQAFVNESVGGLPEAEVVVHIQAMLDKFAWPESPSEILGSLVERRVLRRDGRHIVFARSSFLHLFAAKRAIQDPSFRAVLLDRPIFFSSAIVDYAALFRHDEALLVAMAGLLTEREWGRERGSVFAEILPTAPPEIDAAVKSGVEPHETPSSPEDHDSSSTSVEWFDNSDDDDTPPFPINDEDDVPEGMQLIRALELASLVLRDSDQIENLELRQEILVSVLAHWGTAMSVINTDRSFREFIRSILEEVEENENRDESKFEEFVDELTRAMPAAMILGGVGYVLASRKLTIFLRNAMDSGLLSQSEEVAVPAAFFILSLREPGWVSQLSDLVATQGNVWVIRNFLLWSLLARYQSPSTPDGEADELLSLCIDIIERSTSYSSDAARKQHRSELAQRFRRQRLDRGKRNITEL